MDRESELRGEAVAHFGCVVVAMDGDQRAQSLDLPDHLEAREVTQVSDEVGFLGCVKYGRVERTAAPRHVCVGEDENARHPPASSAMTARAFTRPWITIELYMLRASWKA